ncbi:MAG TPA: sensor histidine kinase [Synergistales bacterium]|nr:sensor histidine kinase [Synergistales bacterium]HPK42662.1 sensor histidine kinase [Synergistales bacterium]
MFLKKSLPIQHKIMLLIVSLVSVTLITAGVFFERGIIPSFEEKQALHARDIAYTVSQMPLVKEQIDRPNHKAVTQPILDNIIEGTNVKLILLIGGRDAQPVIEGIPFSTLPEVTTFGPIVRAYLPVHRDGAKVGAVAVYLWSRDIKTKTWELRKKIILSVIFGLILGTFFAHLLSKNIKRSMLGMEPYQLAALLKEREAFLETVREGIIAIDRDGKIMFVNQQAKEILKVPESEVMAGHLIEKYVPNSRLRRVLASGEPEYDREQNLGGARIFTNRIPIRSGNRILGAIASFRKADEIQTLAEELTGARKLAEVLKVQNELLRVHKHEYLNKLHAISGSIQLEDWDSALRLIHSESDSQQEMIGKIHETIRQPEIAGLLIGKISRGRELGVDLELDYRSSLKERSSVDTNSLIVCLGNLIENATEAVQEPSAPGKKVSVFLEHTDEGLVIEVADTGVGIPAEDRSYIFEKAFSNKAGGKRGYGLFLVRSVVVSYGGSIDFQSTVGEGTRFRVVFPEEGDPV